MKYYHTDESTTHAQSTHRCFVSNDSSLRRITRAALSALLGLTCCFLSLPQPSIAAESGITVVTEPQLVQQSQLVEPVNINSAGLELLQTLPGIGKAKAAAIIEYRQQVGSFESVEDIQNIKGIGEKIYQRLADKIRI